MKIEPSEFEFRSWMKGKEFHLVTNEIELQEMVAEMIDSPKMGFDTETTGLHCVDDRICGYCIAPSINKGFYLPVRHERGVNIDVDKARDAVEILMNEVPLIAMHNAAFDINMLWNEGIDFYDFKRLRDTMVMYWLVDVGMKRKLGLKTVSKQMLNAEMLELYHCFGHTKAPKNFDPRVNILDPTNITVYGASDSMVTIEIANRLENEEWLKKQWGTVLLEMATVVTLAWTQRSPLKLDIDYALAWKEKLERKRSEVEAKIHEIAGRAFNVASPPQLGEVLYKDLGLPIIAVTSEKSNKPSTDEDTIVTLSKKHPHPILDQILTFRGLQKQITTYIEPILRDNKDGWTRIEHYQCGQDTGRIGGRSGDFKKDGKIGTSVSTIPNNKDGELGIFDARQMICARTGYRLVAIDYSNQEMRIAANMSEEESWINTLNNGGDMHAMMGSLMYKKKIEEVTPAERGNAKGLNFRYLFGGGGPWEEDYNTYYEAVPKLKAWQDRMRRQMLNHGYVTSAWGRIRRAEDLVKSSDKKKRNRATRIAVNTPVQSSGADIIRIAAVKFVLGKLFKEHPELRHVVFIQIYIHDELVFEFPTDEHIQNHLPELAAKGWTFEKLLVMACKIMSDVKVPSWRCPLTVEGQFGPTWSCVGATNFEYDIDSEKIIYTGTNPSEADRVNKTFPIEFLVEGDVLTLLINSDLRTKEFLARIRKVLKSSESENGLTVQIQFSDSESKHASPKLYDSESLLDGLAKLKLAAGSIELRKIEKVTS